MRDPQHVGWLPRDAVDVGTGEAGTLEDGAMARIQVRVNRDSRCVDEAVFKAFGCSALIASASLVAEWLHGKTLAAVAELDGWTVVAELQLPIERAHVAALAVAAAKKAVADWERKS